MKYVLTIIIIPLLIGCSTVNKKFIENNYTCHYNDSIFHIQLEPLKNSFIERLKKEKNIIFNDDNFKNRYILFSNGTLSNLKTNKNIGITKFTSFNKNGTIKIILFRCSDTKIGKETHYNQKGEVIKIIDHEKGYKICWTEAIQIVKKIAEKEIKKYKITGVNLTRVSLNKFPNSKPIWYATLDGNEEYKLKKRTTVYWIDGVTGKFIKTTSIGITY